MNNYTKNGIWFRVAANPKGIKEGSTHHWRCFINDEDLVYTLENFVLNGEVNEQNFLPESTTKEGVDPRAWISMYGDVKIESDKGHFSLRNVA
ncbi:MAG: hypothetical protein M3Q64_00355 [bacterium]|nr:hypothetical protein [bacterium]